MKHIHQLSYMSVGGIDLSNAEAYLEAGSCALGLGSSLAGSELIQNKDYKQIEHNSRGFREIAEVPHIKIPANKQKLLDSVHQMELEEFSGLPWYFIPGIKISLNYKGQELKYYDVIRGEESEPFG